jgi:hypothetical protein
MRLAAFLDDGDVIRADDLVRDLQADPFVSEACALSELILTWQPAITVLTYWVGKTLGELRTLSGRRWPCEVMRWLDATEASTLAELADFEERAAYNREQNAGVTGDLCARCGGYYQHEDDCSAKGGRR